MSIEFRINEIVGAKLKDPVIPPFCIEYWTPPMKKLCTPSFILITKTSFAHSIGVWKLSTIVGCNIVKYIALLINCSQSESTVNQHCTFNLFENNVQSIKMCIINTIINAIHILHLYIKCVLRTTWSDGNLFAQSSLIIMFGQSQTFWTSE